MFYVDDAAISWRGRRWYHLMADSEDELHAFADRLGLKREWAQITGHPFPHYDLTGSKRLLAVRLGAVQMTAIGLVKLFRERKSACSNPGS